MSAGTGRIVAPRSTMNATIMRTCWPPCGKPQLRDSEKAKPASGTGNHSITNGGKGGLSTVTPFWPSTGTTSVLIIVVWMRNASTLWSEEISAVHYRSIDNPSRTFRGRLTSGRMPPKSLSCDSANWMSSNAMRSERMNERKNSVILTPIGGLALEQTAMSHPSCSTTCSLTLGPIRVQSSERG